MPEIGMNAILLQVQQPCMLKVNGLGSPCGGSLHPLFWVTQTACSSEAGTYGKSDSERMEILSMFNIKTAGGCEWKISRCIYGICFTVDYTFLPG